MQEEDNAQTGAEVVGANDVRRHHGDQRDIRPFEVTVENDEGNEERKGVKERNEHTAQAVAADR